MSDTCQVNVHDGGRFLTSHKCGRKLSGSDDYPELCGLHASVKRRAKQRQQQTLDRRAQVTAEREAFEARAVAASKALGVPMQVDLTYPVTGPDAHTGQHVTGHVIVSLSDLESLIERLNR
jgi:hypothetical protein